jgi:hypothetical protein
MVLASAAANAFEGLKSALDVDKPLDCLNEASPIFAFCLLPFAF